MSYTPQNVIKEMMADPSVPHPAVAFVKEHNNPYDANAIKVGCHSFVERSSAIALLLRYMSLSGLVTTETAEGDSSTASWCYWMVHARTFVSRERRKQLICAIPAPICRLQH